MSSSEQKFGPKKSLAQADPDSLQKAAECLRALAHPKRLRMIQLLLEGTYTVGQLAEECGLPSHMASEHLRLLQRCGFLTSERDGRKRYYRVVESHLETILKCVSERFGTRPGGTSTTQ